MEATRAPARMFGPAVTRGRSAVRVVDDPLPSFHMRNDARQPTEFGYFLMNRMAAYEPPLTQAELSRRTGIGQATISRWIYLPQLPEPKKLRLLAPAIGVSYEQLLTIAGHGSPTADVTEALSQLRPDMDPLAVELGAMIAEGSALSPSDREFLRHMVNSLIDPYRRTMRKRQSA